LNDLRPHLSAFAQFDLFRADAAIGRPRSGDHDVWFVFDVLAVSSFVVRPGIGMDNRAAHAELDIRTTADE
jgi:hypothetical protein